MPEPSILKINEIFWSFQGEGVKTGFPSIFIRLAGCQLRCPYCDTKDSWEDENARSMKVEAILANVENYKKRYPRSQVVLTGGEPLGQDLSGLVKELKNRNFFLAIETDGLHFQGLPIDWWTVSPKDSTGYTIQPDLITYKKINEIKLVVTPKLNVGKIKEIREKIRGVGEDVPIFLQPEAYDKKRYKRTFSLFQRCQEEGIDNIRAGMQMHKVYNVR